jgi:hypothetical protein
VRPVRVNGPVFPNIAIPVPPEYDVVGAGSVPLPPAPALYVNVYAPLGVGVGVTDPLLLIIFIVPGQGTNPLGLCV